MRIVIHECCGPCSIYPVNMLLDNGFEPHGFFYNPNIHPYTEFKKRFDTTAEFNDRAGIEYTMIDYYGLNEFLEMKNTSVYRCSGCYSMRIERLAIFAASQNIRYITTSLLYSVYQNHELIKSICTKAAEKYGLEFWYEDFRKGWQVGIQLSKEQDMYRQKYCGCIFSEEERYLKKKAGRLQETALP